MIEFKQLTPDFPVGKKATVCLEYNLHNLWIGLHFKRSGLWHIYICLIPCLSIHLRVGR